MKRIQKIIMLGTFSFFIACTPGSEAQDAGHEEAGYSDTEHSDAGQGDTEIEDVNHHDRGALDNALADLRLQDSAPDDAGSSINDSASLHDASISDQGRFDADIDPGTDLGLVQLTYYWIADEDDFSCASADTELRTCDGRLIATVCENFAESARMEGTAHLSDGRSINIGGCSCSGGFSCFVLLDADFPWGIGSRDNALHPYYSIATDTRFLPFGTKVYAPDLVGLAIPEALGGDLGGSLHNGCLRAEDVGGGINGAHIDFFVGRKLWYQQADPLIPENIRLYQDPPASLCP